ncbi:MAG: ACP S-malonyltransferase [Gammaproteobacteria bacterium]|nr:ACP S-malonyltransferase [Gammaproteobacteria bacterium]
MTVAFVFPGQGSQSVGMLGPLAAVEPAVRDTFAEASAVLGYDLWRLVSAGPAEALNTTERTQPALLAAGMAAYRAWRARGGIVPACVAGHSLGEFTALVCAGALEFAAAVDLVRTRGQLMQAAVPSGSGAMAAILGLEDAQVEEACREAAAGAVVEAVNFNSPGQVVIAGEQAAVARAIEAAKARGAKRAVLLPVSVPAHSSLMRPAAEQFAQCLRETRFSRPTLAYVSAVDAATHEDPEELRALLTRQLFSPVRWTQTVRAIAARGVRALVECGPGKVLTALNRRSESRGGMQFLALEDPDTLSAALAATGGDHHA